MNRKIDVFEHRLVIDVFLKCFIEERSRFFSPLKSLFTLWAETQTFITIISSFLTALAMLLSPGTFYASGQTKATSLGSTFLWISISDFEISGDLFKFWEPFK